MLRVAHARYDEKSKRVYVELRVPDNDGTEMFAIALFSFGTGANLSGRHIEQTMVNKARHLFKHAWDALDTKTTRREVGADLRVRRKASLARRRRGMTAENKELFERTSVSD
jgi:hypothetical protein